MIINLIAIFVYLKAIVSDVENVIIKIIPNFNNFRLIKENINTRNRRTLFTDIIPIRH